MDRTIKLNIVLTRIQHFIIFLATPWENPGHFTRFFISKSTRKMFMSFLTSRVSSSLYQTTAACEIPFGWINSQTLRARSWNRALSNSFGVLFSRFKVDMSYFQDALPWKQTRKHKETLTKSNLENWKSSSWSLLVRFSNPGDTLTSTEPQSFTKPLVSKYSCHGAW